MYDSQLSHITTRAMARLHAQMSQGAPFMAGHVFQWLKQLSGSTQPADYFQHPSAFPSLLLPWWLEKTQSREPDIQLQFDLTYSTINGYYYIRLIDNLMDGQATVELQLLPALGFFHTQFQSAYHPYFPADHPFWNFFTQTWLHSAETTMKDARLVDMDEVQFKEIAAQKVCAAKIPLAAVCYRYEQPHLIEPWSEFVDLFGCWHQLLNDLFDWHRDYAHQTCTYFLCEGERRRNLNETITGWVAREGFEWAVQKLQNWMASLKNLAAQLNSPDLRNYLNTRQMMLLNQKEEVAQGLPQLAKIIESHNKNRG